MAAASGSPKHNLTRQPGKGPCGHSRVFSAFRLATDGAGTKCHADTIVASSLNYRHWIELACMMTATADPRRYLSAQN
jgi:hypothetical protein